VAKEIKETGGIVTGGGSGTNFVGTLVRLDKKTGKGKKGNKRMSICADSLVFLLPF
jgi:hypothetical protein